MSMPKIRAAFSPKILFFTSRVSSTASECDATDRKSPRQDRSNKPRREANGGAQCGKSARCVRRGGGWKRGAVETLRRKPARQSSTLRVSSKGWHVQQGPNLPG